MNRFLEILPGALTWLTLALMIVLSWKLPVAVAVFIILFDLYWLLRTVYLFAHLRAAFRAMRANMKVNWLDKLKELERDASMRKPWRMGTCESNDNSHHDIRRISSIRMPQIVEKELSYQINGNFFKVHNDLGRFCRERQYGDALAKELESAGIRFAREVPVEIAGRKSNFVDFVVENRVAIEIKAKSFIDKNDYYQMQRYLSAMHLKLGLLVNFRDRHLKPKRVLNSSIDDHSRHSHAFADWHRDDWRDVCHLVILPMYREPYEVVRDSFKALSSANYPKEKLIVALALEERAEAEARRTAERIKKEYGKRFGNFLVTVHPDNIAGEIRGKGSNETWAAREAKRLLIDPLIREERGKRKEDSPAKGTDGRNLSSLSSSPFPLSYANFLVSVFDIDTQILPDYFGRLTYVFLKATNPYRAIYQPVPIFTNNIYQAPALARVISFSSTFWQMMQQARPERMISFSSQSIPFQALQDVGFWETDVISEDSRIFWQGYLHYGGDFRCEPLLYPVFMDSNAAPSFWTTMKNTYKQLRRHAWGAENIPYIMRKFSRSRLIPLKSKIYWTLDQIESYHSWATNSLMIFALGWLPILLGGRSFNYTLLSYRLPQVTSFIVNVSMFGVATSALLGMLLLPPKPEWFRARHYVLYTIQWLLLPITLIVFGSIPAIDAQTRLALGGRFRLEFWVTPKGRYPGIGKRVGKTGLRPSKRLRSAKAGVFPRRSYQNPR